LKKTVLILVTILPIICQAQYGNVWTFGYNYGIDFNSGAPVFFDTTAIFCRQGSANICDSSGQLLFYTDGTHVWNKLHQLMPNGDSLAYICTDILGLGIPENSLQPAVIIPIENTSQYYIFTTDSWFDGLGPNRLKYHIVDIAADNGLGDVVLKNQIMTDQIGEKLAATRHCNGLDWWVIVRSTTSDKFLSFLVTPTGVSTNPIISHTGLFDNDALNLVVSQLKISPNGKYIANSLNLYGFEFGTFNNATGEIEITFRDFNYNTVLGMGCAFSSDSKYMYSSVQNYIPDTITNIPNTDVYINRYNIENTDSATIMQTKYVMLQRDSLIIIFSLQIAPDGHIYARGYIRDSTETLQLIRDELFVIKEGNDSLIETPIYFAHPNLLSSWGLPSFPDAIFTNHHKASLRIPTCVAGVYDSIPFYDSLLTTTRDYLWDFGDPASGINNTFNGQFPVHAFSSPGIYTVTLTLPSDCNPITIAQQVIANPTSAITPVITLNNIYLESTPAAQYQWFLNNNLIVGATNQIYTPTANGDYTVTITDSNNCTQTSAVFNLTNVGLRTNNNPSNFSVYPNPANHLIQINNPTQKQTTFTITDLVGNVIIKTTINKSTESINIASLSNGIYLITIDDIFNQKLVVNH
jgi:hypothetical protein